MRQISSKRRAWLQRRQAVRHSERLFSAGVARAKAPVKRDTLTAPAYFCLVVKKNEPSLANVEFLAFLRKIRNFKGSHVCIDMSRVQRMIVNATLLFKAELAYLSKRGTKISGVMPRKPRTYQVLTQTGITKLMGLPDCTSIDREDTVHWRYAGGAWNKAQPSRLEALLGDTQAGNASLYTGMIESVANCIEHAYRDHPKRRAFSTNDDGWWGFQQLRDGILCTCICDLGIGIARSLPLKLADEPGLLKKLVSLFNHIRGEDVRSILAAIEYGRTSTHQIQRGKGLRDAHQVIDDAGEGQFHIFSNKGMYYYSLERGKKAEWTTRRLAESIEGTIYYWQYPIQLQSDAGATPAQGE